MNIRSPALSSLLLSLSVREASHDSVSDGLNSTNSTIYSIINLIKM